MHLPDGIVTSPAVLAGGAAVAAAGLTIAYHRCRRELEERTVAVAGVMAAFLFAAQMVNFPIGFGVSGHLLGGALAAIVLGPWLGALVVALVLIPQCLLFADGGLLSLGLNITAMALVGTFAGGALASALGRVLPRPVAWFLAGWGSVVLASMTIGLAVVLGSDVAGGLFLKTLIGVHLLIGVGEGLITAGVLSALARLRPDLVGEASARRWGWGETLAGLAAAVLVVVALSPLASAAPDGLEASLDHAAPVATAHEESPIPSPTNGYTLAGVSDATLGGILAGLIGVFLTLGVAHAALGPSAHPRRSG
jgi:cobalt/nickel transport system permease protein